MGFHKRYIDNTQVIDIYRTEGIQGVEDWYTKGADALITEEGLATLITDILDLPLLTEIDKWNEISEEISSESIKRGFNEKEEKTVTPS